MKKWLCVVLVGALLFGFTACNDTPDASEGNGTTATTTTTANDDTTKATNADTAADLYFPIHNAALKHPTKL